MATSQHFVNWVCGPRLNPRFLWLLFRSKMQSHFSSLTAGATLRTIGMPEVRRFKIPLPPLDEQKELVEAADEERGRVSALHVAIAKQVALLRERRRALITAAVTGQMAVPGVEAA